MKGNEFGLLASLSVSICALSVFICGPKEKAPVSCETEAMKDSGRGI